MPLGGIGAARIEIRPSGSFFASGGLVPLTFQLIHQADSKTRHFRLNSLVGTAGDSQLASNIRYQAKVPFATLNYHFHDLSLEVILSAWSPFVPHQINCSSFSAAVLEFTVCNMTANHCQIAVIPALSGASEFKLHHLNSPDSRINLAPAETRSVTFLLSWPGIAFPAEQRIPLEAATRQFHSAFFESTLPAWELDAISASWAESLISPSGFSPWFQMCEHITGCNGLYSAAAKLIQNGQREAGRECAYAAFLQREQAGHRFILSEAGWAESAWSLYFAEFGIDYDASGELLQLSPPGHDCQFVVITQTGWATACWREADAFLTLQNQCGDLRIKTVEIRGRAVQVQIKPTSS